MKRIGTGAVGFAFSGAFYLLLIDTVDLPELYAGCAAALLAAIVFEASREQGFVEAVISPVWLVRIWRVLLQLPVQLVLVSVEAVDQLIVRKPSRGAFRTVSFNAGGDDARAAGRRALAEALGSLTPNTIVIGIDPERDLLLVHQLHRQDGRDKFDPLELG